GKQKASAGDARPAVADWIDSLTNGRGDGDADVKRLMGLKVRLARQAPAPEPPRAHDRVGVPPEPAPGAVSSGNAAEPSAAPISGNRRPLRATRGRQSRIGSTHSRTAGATVTPT